MARNGKVARLPKWLRDRLNEKLQDGESGVTLVAWLKEFWDQNGDISDAVGPEPINEQNVSAWRQGGYRDWERRQSAADLVRDLAEHAQDLKNGADGREVSDRLSVALMGELARVAEALLAETTGTRERWEVLKDVLRELTRVRLADHRAAKLAREQADWEARQPKRVAPDPMTELHQQMITTKAAARFAGSLHRKGGRSEGNWEMAAREAELEFGLPLGTLNAGQASGEPAVGHDVRSVPGSLPSPTPGEGSESPANEGESSKIKENQGGQGKCGVGSAEFPLRSEASAGQGGVGTKPTENPPSSEFSTASPEKTEDEEEDEHEDDEEAAADEAAAPASTGFEPGMGQQYAEDGTPLPPGVRWKFVCNPYFSGPSRKMFLVNAAGEEVTQDGRPIATADAAESGKIKENQGWSEAQPELPPGVYSTIPELPADGSSGQPEEQPEEWEDGGWMKKRPRKGG